MPPEIAPALVDTGYDACSTASNHTMDAGAAGIDRTLDTLDADHLRHTGSARSAAEARKVLTFDVRGTKVALLSYAYGLNGRSNPPGEPWHVNIIDPAKILADAHRAKAGGADIVVVALHWGVEYVHPPTAMQRTLAQHPDRQPGRRRRLRAPRPRRPARGRRCTASGSSTASGNCPLRHTASRSSTTARGCWCASSWCEDASGHWRSGRLDWVPSFMTRAPLPASGSTSVPR